MRNVHESGELAMMESVKYIYMSDSQTKVGRDGLMVSVFGSHSHKVGHGFASRPGHIKYHNKNCTNFFTAWHACIRVGVWQCSPTA